MLVIQEMHKYVTRHEDEIAGPFDSWETARAWLNSLSGDRGDQAYIERLEDPVKVKALWSGWDAETDEAAVEAAVSLASEHDDG